MTKADIVALYNAKNRKAKECVLAWMAKRASLEEAIEAAAMARICGKRHPHQRRLKVCSLEKGTRDLLAKAHDISACRDFDELLNLVDKAVRSVSGLGELYIYDTAERIGAFLGKLPEKVYLHAGTRKGAENWGLDTNAGVIEMKDLPRELQALKPHEVEDLLCIYKDQKPDVRRCCGVGEIEDEADTQAAVEALDEAGKSGTMPWQDIKADLGL